MNKFEEFYEKYKEIIINLYKELDVFNKTGWDEENFACEIYLELQTPVKDLRGRQNT